MPDRREVLPGVGRFEARDPDRRDGGRPFDGQVVELAEMAVVADRVADHDQARRRQAMDRRPDRRRDAAGLVDDDEQIAGMLAAEPLLDTPPRTRAPPSRSPASR